MPALVGCWLKNFMYCASLCSLAWNDVQDHHVVPQHEMMLFKNLHTKIHRHNKDPNCIILDIDRLLKLAGDHHDLKYYDLGQSGKPCMDNYHPSRVHHHRR